MGPLSFPKASRKLQRTLKNLKVSVLCFILTFLVLRNTIGAGKFGTPAQDFEEIRLHLHNVGLHRRHFRVLAEAVEEENSPSLTPEDKQRSALYGESDEGEGYQSNLLPVEKAERGELHDKAPYLSQKSKDMNAPFSLLKKMQGSAELLTQDVKRHNAPLSTIANGMHGFRFSEADEQGKVRKARAQQTNVLLVLGLQSSGCKKSAGDLLILKSLQNKVDYSRLHGYEVSTGFGDLDPSASEPISRLSLLQSAMLKYSHVEWLWWVPHETVVITDMGFELPLDTYLDFNLILLGSVGASYHQDNLMIDLKTDTFLIRNCQWSAGLLEKSVNTGSVEFISPDIIIIRGPEHALDDTSVHGIPPNQQGRPSREKIHVEDAAVLRSHWRDLALKIERSKLHPRAGADDKRLPFVTDLLGCNVGCEADKKVGLCSKHIESILLLVEKQFGSETQSLALSK